MLKTLLITASLFLVSSPAFADNPPIKCRDGFEWNDEQKMCLPVPKKDDGGSSTRPTSPKPQGSFCDQYPQDPMCGGNIPKPVVPPIK